MAAGAGRSRALTRLFAIGGATGSSQALASRALASQPLAAQPLAGQKLAQLSLLAASGNDFGGVKA